LSVKKELPKKKIDWGWEIIMTFSNQKSMLYSKKIERFIIFWVFLIITIIYVIRNIDNLEAFDMVEILAIWLAAASFNSIMSNRDRKLEVEQNKPDNIE